MASMAPSLSFHRAVTGAEVEAGREAVREAKEGTTASTTLIKVEVEEQGEPLGGEGLEAAGA